MFCIITEDDGSETLHKVNLQEIVTILTFCLNLPKGTRSSHRLVSHSEASELHSQSPANKRATS